MTSPSATLPTRVAIIGDRFMQPQDFAEALRTALGHTPLDIRSLELSWPDVPMIHGWTPQGPASLQGLREYLGEPEAIAAFVGDARVLINHLAPISAQVLEHCSHLRLIAAARGGPLNIDMAAARARGIAVVNTPGRNASAVAECTIGMILAQTRLLTVAHAALSRGHWRGDLYRADRTGDELCSMTVGLVGYGHIGSRVTKLLRPFGCRILVCDPHVALDTTDREAGVQQVDFDTLLGASDVLSLHARVTPHTRGMMNAAAFARMRRGAWFINTARGPLVDQDALHEALRSGHLRGAALDTFAAEPCPENEALLKLPQVTLTPHIAGASRHTVRRTAQMVAEEVRRHLAGEDALHPC